MILAFIASIVLAIVVFAFVLEPVLRARADSVVLDEVALPRSPERVEDDEQAEALGSEIEPETAGYLSHPRTQIDRPVGSDLT